MFTAVACTSQAANKGGERDEWLVVVVAIKVTRNVYSA